VRADFYQQRTPALVTTAQKCVRDGEDVCTMTGGTGKATKRYYMQAWSDGPASEFRHLRLTVLVATSCGATGIDSKWCAAVVRSGPPGSPIDLLQERGRIRAQGTEYPYEYHVVLTLSTWASLLQRISQIPSHYRGNL